MKAAEFICKINTLAKDFLRLDEAKGTFCNIELHPKCVRTVPEPHYRFFPNKPSWLLDGILYTIFFKAMNDKQPPAFRLGTQDFYVITVAELNALPNAGLTELIEFFAFLFLKVLASITTKTQEKSNCLQKCNHPSSIHFSIGIIYLEPKIVISTDAEKNTVIQELAKKFKAIGLSEHPFDNKKLIVNGEDGDQVVGFLTAVQKAFPGASILEQRSNVSEEKIEPSALKSKKIP